MWARAVQALQPRLLLCGPEGAGQRHLAPAVLYALEGLPVHALGLPALLSDASARRALLHHDTGWEKLWLTCGEPFRAP